MWAKAIQALSDIGYDATNLAAMPYDWRLSIPNLELRDGYFTRLRAKARPLLHHCFDMGGKHCRQDSIWLKHRPPRGSAHWSHTLRPTWVSQDNSFRTLTRLPGQATCQGCLPGLLGRHRCTAARPTLAAP